MRFRFAHALSVPVAAAERALLDPETLLAMPEGMALVASVEPVGRFVEGTRIVRVARFTPRAEALDMPRFADPSWAAWEERVEWDRALDRGRFTIRPELPPRWQRAFHCAGTYTLLPTDAGCERVVEGELRVRAPLIGPAVERYAVDRLRLAFDDEARLLEARAWR